MDNCLIKNINILYLLGQKCYNNYDKRPSKGVLMKYEESNQIELKQELNDEIKNEIVAFLNTEGGIIYVGVSDDGNPIGFSDGKERDLIDSKVSNWIQEAFFPLPSNLIKHYFNADNVLAIEVIKGNERPYYLKEKGPKPSGVYKRVGRSTRKANDSEILLMLLESKDYSYEDDVSEEQDLTFRYFFDVCEQNNIPHDKRNLCSLRVIEKNGQYTNLAFLLSDQSPMVVKLGKYDKNMNFIVKKEFSGSLLKALDNVLDSAATFNDVSAVIDGSSWTRIETVSYPGASLREGILNAVAHANYFIRSNIKIEFYDDMVKITNPGGIYQATLEQILEGVQTYRNPRLVNILNKLHYIENFGTGIPRILEAYKDSEYKPIFEPSDNFFILKLPNLNYSDPVNDPVNDPVYDELNDFELAIMKIIKNNPGSNAPKILELVSKEFPNATIDMVKNSLKRKLSKYCKFDGSFRNGGYIIIKR